MDIWPPDKRSEVMARIRSAGTEPEERLFAVVRAALPRHRLDRNVRTLPGAPDLVLPHLDLALFVHGCFWHACPIHGRVPDTRQDYWLPKLEATRRRDRRNTRALRSAGYGVWQIWEHQLEGRELERTAAQLTARLQKRARARRRRSG